MQLEYLPRKASNVGLSKRHEEHLQTLNILDFFWSDSVKMSAYSPSRLAKFLHHSCIYILGRYIASWGRKFGLPWEQDVVEWGQIHIQVTLEEFSVSCSLPSLLQI